MYSFQRQPETRQPPPRDRMIVVTVGHAVRGVHGPFTVNQVRNALKKIRPLYNPAANCGVHKIKEIPGDRPR